MLGSLIVSALAQSGPLDAGWSILPNTTPDSVCAARGRTPTRRLASARRTTRASERFSDVPKWNGFVVVNCSKLDARFYRLAAPPTAFDAGMLPDAGVTRPADGGARADLFAKALERVTVRQAFFTVNAGREARGQHPGGVVGAGHGAPRTAEPLAR